MQVCYPSPLRVEAILRALDRAEMRVHVGCWQNGRTKCVWGMFCYWTMAYVCCGQIHCGTAATIVIQLRA